MKSVKNLKLCMIITFNEYYTYTLLSVNLTFIQGHKVSIMWSWMWVVWEFALLVDSHENVSLCYRQYSSVQPASRPCPKLNIGFFSVVTEATFLKLHMLITTIDLYPWVSKLVTFDLYLGHRLNIQVKWAVSISWELLFSPRWNLMCL